MKKRLLALLAVVALVLTCAVGCGEETDKPGKGKDNEKINKAQLVIALNPIITYDDGTAVVAYNDIKNAIKADRESSSLTSMYDNTSWQWVYEQTDSWKARATYDLAKWVSGTGATVKKTNAYSFVNDGTTSLMSYSSANVKLATYDDQAAPDYGIVMSVTGGEEEALCYTVEQDGKISFPAGAINAIDSIGDVKTGFLAEDGTMRSASVRILVNDQQIWSDTLMNAEAAEDGVAVTSLSYDKLGPVAVKEGDMVFISVKLDAAANVDEDVTLPAINDEDNYTTVKHVTKKEKVITVNDDVVSKEEPLSMIYDYACRFVLYRDSALPAEILKQVTEMRQYMEESMDDDIVLNNELKKEQTYEIVIGASKARPESVKIDNEVRTKRVDNANDFIIRRVDTKIYIAAPNALAMQKAIEYFEKTFVDTEDDIPAGYNYVYCPTNTKYMIGGVNIGQYVIRYERYPSHLVTLAAGQLHDLILSKCGYDIKQEAMQKDGKHYTYEIQVGPMLTSAKMKRSGGADPYQVRFTSADANRYFDVDPDGLLNIADNEYQIKMSGKNLVFNGGTTYAINAGMQVFLKTLEKDKSIPANYALNGKYLTSDAEKQYSLTDGLGLTLAEDFTYEGTELEKEAAVKNKWTISSDTTNGPTLLDAANDIWDKQKRPGVYGENYWIWNDKTGNGYLLEITKKESYGYDAGRVISQNKWGFRYGLWETRLVMGTHNGACSAVWASSGAPTGVTIRNEIDVYENFGRDYVVMNLHTWAPDDMGGHVNHNATSAMDAQRIFGENWCDKGEGFYNTFHTIGILWGKNFCDGYLDGQCFTAVDTSSNEFKSMRNPTTIKLANGVGTGTYSRGYDPVDWLKENVDNFFEVQVVDYTRLFQWDPTGLPSSQKSQLKFASKSIEKAYATSITFE